MATDVMIYANDLSKRFGTFRALDKVSFEVRKGEVVGFLGPNGAGKSTTMRILTCFLAPSDGTARVRGFDVFEQPLDVRRSLGYLPQRAPLYLEMSVLEYLKFAADLRQIDAPTFKSRAKNVVEVGIPDIDRTHPGLAAMVGRGNYWVLGNGISLGAQRNGDGRVRIGLSFYNTGEDWFATSGIPFDDPAAARARLIELLSGWDSRFTALIAACDDTIVPRSLTTLPVGLTWQSTPGVASAIQSCAVPGKSLKDTVTVSP